jgi:GNAT superfamily N-acetyltransferase
MAVSPAWAKEKAMTELIGSATDTAASALYAVLTRYTEFMPGGYARQGAAGTRLFVSTIPVPQGNRVTADGKWDPGEVDAFARELSATGLPWSIQVRGDEVDPRLAELGARHGRTAVSTFPLLHWDAAPLPEPRALPPGATVREIPGADAGVFAGALAAGFEMPIEVAAVIAAPSLLDAPGVTAFVLDLHGEAVATGLNVIVGDYVGLFSGSVPPEHRLNGYYRALVTARLTHASASGARHAVVQNAPGSRPLYESLGFRVAENWTYLTAAE